MRTWIHTGCRPGYIPVAGLDTYRLQAWVHTAAAWMRGVTAYVRSEKGRARESGSEGERERGSEGARERGRVRDRPGGAAKYVLLSTYCLVLTA